LDYSKPVTYEIAHGVEMTPPFTSPPGRAAFNSLVWEIVRQIPPGRVSSYGQIAAMIPPPPGMSGRDFAAWGARWVGGAMAGCPSDVPWQRVLNAQGKVSLRSGSGGEEQRTLLESEGLQFDDRDRVDLSRYGWEGPSEEWSRAHGLVVQFGGNE
jgi:methylated-DNA-protein-cysteine methyltransferase related protein